MPKVKPKLTAGVAGRLPRHSLDVGRGNSSFGHGRDKATVKRLQMYKTKSHKRDRDGKIIADAGDLTSRTPELGAGRTAPNRKWFGNTRVVQQKDLARLRDAVTSTVQDPYRVLLKQRKLPMGLIVDADTEARSLAGTQLGLLANEPFEDTFSKKKRRKRPKLDTCSMAELAAKADARSQTFDNDADVKLANAEKQALAAAAEGPHDPDVKEGLRYDDLKDAASDAVFAKGQSRRIWGELHKVIDSSDVVIQVLDARDPLGTRCKYLETFMKREAPHKHMVLLLNKCDLVPTWVSSRWLRILSREYPTLVFHSSVTNPFGKGSLINLLRQFKRLHSEKKSISCGLVGYPNVGKSSVINTLRGKKVANVAPVPGETKVWQYVTLFRSVFLVDCPGVVHDSSHNSEAESVLKSVVRVESLGTRASEYVPALLDRVDPKYLARTYGIASWSSPDDFLEKFARKAGKLLKKGEPDVNAVGRMMLADFQRGKLPWFVQPPDEIERPDAEGSALFEIGRARRPRERTEQDEATEILDRGKVVVEGDDEDESGPGLSNGGENLIGNRPAVVVERQDLSKLKTSERLVATPRSRK
jgi:nuclear GTP-binding protein